MEVQTDSGKPVDYGCQYPNIERSEIKLDKTTQEKKLVQFLKGQVDFIEQVIENRAISKKEEK